MRPILAIGYDLEVVGSERFGEVREPALLIANHCMHLDMALLLRAMPPELRRRMAIAAAASDIFGNPVRGFGSALLGNAFPFAKEGGGIRDSLEYVDIMLREGWSVLIFPEGRLTVIGPMQPFKGGIGLLARETGAPVLPVRIDVVRPGFWEGRWWPNPRGRVRVTVGEPVRIDSGMHIADATALLERAVREA
jgi:1-acyl-sn-glycerol-3-phosphate acyltransferase